MGRGVEAEQASSNARTQSVSDAELLIAMRSRSIESEANVSEFASLLPFGNKRRSDRSPDEGPARSRAARNPGRRCHIIGA
jgi:hypothetical protein